MKKKKSIKSPRSQPLPSSDKSKTKFERKEIYSKRVENKVLTPNENTNAQPTYDLRGNSDKRQELNSFDSMQPLNFAKSKKGVINTIEFSLNSI